MPVPMPQLSPMLGILMFSTVLAFYFILICGLSKKTPFIKPTSLSDLSKSSFPFFK